MTRAEAERRVIEAARQIRNGWFRDATPAYGMNHTEWELDAALRELDTFALPADDGCRPISEHPDGPAAVEFYHGNWPTEPEDYRHLKRSHGYWGGSDDWAGATWYDEGTNHEIFEFPDMTDHHPTHWRPLPAPPDGGGRNGE